MPISNLSDLQTLTAGETLTASLTLLDYPRSAGWSVTVCINGTGWCASQAATSGTGTDDYSLTVPYAVTALWLAGFARWTVWATKDDNRYVASSGYFSVAGNPLVVSHNQTVLAAIRALILGRATDDQRTTAIEGIAIQYATPEQLTLWESIYAQRVARELGGNTRNAIRFVLPT